jgi:hypothetical protein
MCIQFSFKLTISEKTKAPKLGPVQGTKMLCNESLKIAPSALGTVL